MQGNKLSAGLVTYIIIPLDDSTGSARLHDTLYTGLAISNMYA